MTSTGRYTSQKGARWGHGSVCFFLPCLFGLSQERSLWCKASVRAGENATCFTRKRKSPFSSHLAVLLREGGWGREGHHLFYPKMENSVLLPKNVMYSCEKTSKYCKAIIYLTLGSVSEMKRVERRRLRMPTWATPHDRWHHKLRGGQRYELTQRWPLHTILQNILLQNDTRTLNQEPKLVKL